MVKKTDSQPKSKLHQNPAAVTEDAVSLSKFYDIAMRAAVGYTMMVLWGELHSPSRPYVGLLPSREDIAFWYTRPVLAMETNRRDFMVPYGHNICVLHDSCVA